MLKIHFLGSGSSGNATVISYASTNILMDCGFSAKELRHRLHNVGLTPEELNAALLSHEHHDHVSGLHLFHKKTNFPIFLTRGTARAIRSKSLRNCELQWIQAGSDFVLKDFRVSPFEVSHDAQEPVGFVFRLPNNTRLGFATDTGTITPHAVEALRGCDWIGLESNHDIDMLLQGPYPWFLKQRIRSDHGHLSNLAAAKLLDRVAEDNLKNIFAMHISKTNNRPRRVFKTLSQALSKKGLEVSLKVIEQNKTFSWLAGQQLSLFT